MILVGLTGSFGSGKSAVATMFSERGIPVQDADQVARDVVRNGTTGLDEVVRQFGAEVLGSDGEMDRAKVAAIVFGDPAARQRLNAIIHPKVREEQMRFVQANAAAPIVVLEIPLLLESGGRGAMNKVVVVTASERIRFARLKGRGFGEKEVIARLGTQMPQAVKVSKADYVITNDGTLDETRKQVWRVIEQITAENAKGKAKS